MRGLRLKTGWTTVAFNAATKWYHGTSCRSQSLSTIMARRGCSTDLVQNLVITLSFVEMPSFSLQDV